MNKNFTYYIVFHHHAFGMDFYKFKTTTKNINDKKIAEFLEIDTSDLIFDDEGSFLYEETITQTGENLRILKDTTPEEIKEFK